ncbi:MAG: 3-oxoacyl-ACP synthase [Christensenellales bacterium]|jgi:3-oxoacyl-[acyl-carrier-protein] synthase-3
METIKCGIVGFGFAFPEGIRDSAEIAKLSGIPEDVIRNKFGINKLYWPKNNEQTSDLAVLAAQDCLKNTGIDPLEIDLIIYFGENYGDHIIYSIGPKVQGEIGAKNAWCYNVECKCGSALLAMDQAMKYMQTEESINTIMLVGGYRNVDRVDYTDNAVSFLFNLSCGGAACIIKKGYEKHNLLSFGAVTDGVFSDTIVIPGGGTKCPITKENIDNQYLHYFRLEDPVAFREELGKVTFKNIMKTQEIALAKIGKTLKDLDFAIILHMNVRSHKTVLDMLGLTPEQSYYLSEYGHVGQLDPLIALNNASKEGKLREGDLVAIVALGIGYIWNGGVLRW